LSTRRSDQTRGCVDDDDDDDEDEEVACDGGEEVDGDRAASSLA
jgi:hypothetical protein